MTQICEYTTTQRPNKGFFLDPLNEFRVDEPKESSLHSWKEKKRRLLESNLSESVCSIFTKGKFASKTLHWASISVLRASVNGALQAKRAIRHLSEW